MSFIFTIFFSVLLNKYLDCMNNNENKKIQIIYLLATEINNTLLLNNFHRILNVFMLFHDSQKNKNCKKYFHIY